MKHPQSTGSEYFINKNAFLLLVALCVHVSCVSGDRAPSVTRASKMFSSFSLNLPNQGAMRQTPSEQSHELGQSKSPRGEDILHAKGSLARFFDSSSDNEANESSDWHSYTASEAAAVKKSSSSASNDKSSPSSGKDASDVKSNGHQIDHSNYRSDEGLRSGNGDETSEKTAKYSPIDSHLQSDGAAAAATSLVHLRGASNSWAPTFDHRAQKNHFIRPSSVDLHTLADSFADETSNRAKYSPVKTIIVSPQQMTRGREESFAQGPLGNYDRVVGVNKELADQDKSDSTIRQQATLASESFTRQGKHSRPEHTSSSSRRFSPPAVITASSPSTHSNDRDFINPPSNTFNSHKRLGPAMSDDENNVSLAGTGSSESAFNSAVSSPPTSHSGQRAHSQRVNSHGKHKTLVSSQLSNHERDNYQRRSFSPVKHYHDHQATKATQSNYRISDSSKVDDAQGDEAKSESDIYFDDTPNTNGYQGGESSDSSHQRSDEDARDTKSPFDMSPLKEDVDSSVKSFGDSSGERDSFVSSDMDKDVSAAISSSASHAMDANAFRPGRRDSLIAEPSHQNRQGGGDQHGWLDMGAYSGKHGAFGWYADFPVGGAAAAAHPYAASSKQHAHHQAHPGDHHSLHSIG